MALEDAAVLAKAADISNREEAFATYEHLRRARTVKMYKVGVQGDCNTLFVPCSNGSEI